MDRPHALPPLDLALRHRPPGRHRLRARQGRQEEDYECPILKEQAKRKQEIQKELKALTKELRPKKKKTSKCFFEEEKEDMTEDEKKNDMLASYHKEQKKYKTNQVAKPIPKSKAS
jgi:hypothetical protein